MIPDNITRDSVLSAIEEIKKNGIPQNRRAENYFLIYDNFIYPPKYILSISNKFVNGKELDSIGFSRGAGFSGGAETNGFLERLGFSLVRKPSELLDLFKNKFACSSNDKVLSNSKSKNILSLLGYCLFDSGDLRANTKFASVSFFL